MSKLEWSILKIALVGDEDRGTSSLILGMEIERLSREPDQSLAALLELSRMKPEKMARKWLNNNYVRSIRECVFD